MPKIKNIFEPLFNNCCMIEAKRNSNLAYEYFLDGIRKYNITLTEKEKLSLLNNSSNYGFVFRFLEENNANF